MTSDETRPAGEETDDRPENPDEAEQMPSRSDPGGSPEDEGIPDLQDGTPQQQRANDPQQQPVPGDGPTEVSLDPPTPEEMRAGETLDARLDEEEPEEDPRSPAEGGGETTGDRAGRLRNDPEATPPRRQDVYGEETDATGLTAEEEATRSVDEDEV